MAESKIPSKYDATTAETLNGVAVSGEVKLVRCGKIRQITFNDAKTPFTFPTLQASDRPKYLAQTVLLTQPNNLGLVWIRTDGTFGYFGVYNDFLYNGTLTWVVA